MKLTLWFVLLFPCLLFAQPKAVVNHISSEPGLVNVSYDIHSESPNAKYRIALVLYSTYGNRILPTKTFTGDIRDLTAGQNYSVVWHAKEDGQTIDETVHVVLAVYQQLDIPIVQHAAKSAVIPGWGDYKLRNGKHHILYGVIGYGAIGASIFYNIKAAQTYSSYKQSFETEQSNQLFQQARKYQTISQVAAGLAVVTWTIDLAMLYPKYKTVKRELTPTSSKYYFDVVNTPNTTTSSNYMVNTKSPGEIALERGDQLHAEQNYAQAKLEYESAKRLGLNASLADSRIAVCNEEIRKLEELEKLFQSHIAKGDQYFNAGEFEMAKQSYQSAVMLKPENKIAQQKVQSAMQAIEILENQARCTRLLEQAKLQLTTNNFTGSLNTISDMKKCGYFLEEANALEIQIIQKRDEIKAKKDKRSYDSLFTLAQSEERAGKLQEAYWHYNQADGLYESETEAAKRASRCEDIMKRQKEEMDIISYNKCLDDADKLTKKHLYSKAKDKYLEALTYQPQETEFINKKIKDINSYLTNEDPDTRFGKTYALIVGIGDYKNAGEAIALLFDGANDLKHAKDDAYKFQIFLQTKTGGSVPIENIVMLTDLKATKKDILNDAKRLFALATSNDRVIFYFSGHGSAGEIIPADYAGGDYDGISRAELSSLLSNCKARHKLAVIDACNSGSMKGFNSLSNVLDNSKPGYAYLMSSQAYERSREDPIHQQGLFSYYLLEGAYGKADTNGDKLVTIDELFQYLSKKVSYYSNYKQNPKIEGEFDLNMPFSILE